MSRPITQYIIITSKNSHIPDGATCILYDLPTEPLPKLPPNLKQLRLDGYDHPLQKSCLPQSLVMLYINGPYKYSIPSHLNLRFLTVLTSLVQFNKASLPNVKKLTVPSNLKIPIDAYLPSLESLYIYRQGGILKEHLLHNQYNYYLLSYNIEYYMGDIQLCNKFFTNLNERTKINNHNKRKRHNSLFDDLL